MVALGFGSQRLQMFVPLLKITVAFQNARVFHDVYGVTGMRAVLASWAGQVQV